MFSRTEHGRKAQRDAASGKRTVEMGPTIPEEWKTVHISFVGRNLELQLVRELQWYLLMYVCQRSGSPARSNQVVAGSSS